MNKFLLSLLTTSFLFGSSAYAASICVKTKIPVGTDRKVSMAKQYKTVSGSICPTGYTKVASSSSFVGPQGPQGPQGVPGAQGVQGAQGPAGIQGIPGNINLATCITETKTGTSCAEGTACPTELSCGDPGNRGSQVGDLMIFWAFTVSNQSAYIVENHFATYGSNEYPTGTYIITTSEAGWGAYTPSLAIVCCSPN